MRIGASALLLEQATPPQLLQGIQEHRATICFTAPTAYRAMAGLAKGFDLSSLKKCVSAGETLPKPTFEAWQQATGLKIIDGIGSTEMLHIFISAADDDIRPGSTGKAVPGYEARVVDEDCNEVPPGTIGRLAVKGPTGCRYLANLERQRAYVENGWNLTGDSYVMDADGYFWYQARTDDMIISAGNNIAGPEVESRAARSSDSDRMRRGGRARRGARPDREGLRGPAPWLRRRAPSWSRSCRTSSSRRSRPTSTRGPSSSSTPCRAPKPASSSASACGSMET